jgi:conjugal transfer pilus assembly protein TraA
MKFISTKLGDRAAFVALAVVASAAAVAGGGGQQQFGTLANQLTGWAQGSLGIVIAIASLLVGLSVGVVKQSLMAVVTGIGIAIALYYGPEVISGVLSATGAVVDVVAPAAAALPIL